MGAWVSAAAPPWAAARVWVQCSGQCIGAQRKGARTHCLVHRDCLGVGQVQWAKASGRRGECSIGGHKNDSRELRVDGWQQGLCAQHVGCEVPSRLIGQEGADGRVGAAASRGAVKVCQVDLVGGGHQDAVDNVNSGVNWSRASAVRSNVADVGCHHLSLVHSKGRVACQDQAAQGCVQVLAAGSERGRKGGGSNPVSHDCCCWVCYRRGWAVMGCAATRASRQPALHQSDPPARKSPHSLTPVHACGGSHASVQAAMVQWWQLALSGAAECAHACTHASAPREHPKGG